MWSTTYGSDRLDLTFEMVMGTRSSVSAENSSIRERGWDNLVPWELKQGKPCTHWIRGPRSPHTRP